MTQLGMELSGLEELERSSAAVLQVLTAEDTAEEAARLIAARARPLVPVWSGLLAASETVTSGHLVYAARHAPIVHARQPWLGDAISAVIPQLVALYGDAAVQAWDTP